jgi:hypothetical protein
VLPLPLASRCGLSLFSDADIAKLLAASDGTIGSVYDQADIERYCSAPTLSCHLDQPGTAHPMRLYAGWLAVVGPEHMGIRMSVIAGRLPAEALSPGDGWPELYRDLEELLTHRRALLPEGHGPADAALLTQDVVDSLPG